jgi:hypothetical protein
MASSFFSSYYSSIHHSSVQRDSRHTSQCCCACVPHGGCSRLFAETVSSLMFVVFDEMFRNPDIFPLQCVTALNRHTLTRRKPYCIEPVPPRYIRGYDAEVAGRTIIGRALYVDPQTLYQPPHPQPTRHTDGQGMRPQAHVGSWSCAFSTCGRDGGRAHSYHTTHVAPRAKDPACHKRPSPKPNPRTRLRSLPKPPAERRASGARA